MNNMIPYRKMDCKIEFNKLYDELYAELLDGEDWITKSYLQPILENFQQKVLSLMNTYEDQKK